MPPVTRTLAHLDATHGADAVSLLGPALEDDKTGNTMQSAVVGTYRLEQSQENQCLSQRRVGTIDVVSVIRSKSDPPSFALERRSAFPLPAVLDVSPIQHSAIHDVDQTSFVAACADGALYLCTSTTPFHTVDAKAITPVPQASGTLALSVHAAAGDVGDLVVASSDSAGIVNVHRFEIEKLTLLSQRRMHDAEAWTAHVVNKSHTMSNTVMSGGDDGKLSAFDLRNATENIWTIRDAHRGLGVTTIASSGSMPELFWSGGYDDCIRQWDTRLPGVPVSAYSLDAGGGVWRLRFHPCYPHLLLVAAMYDGCKIVELNPNKSLQIHASYKEHQSIAYGATWISNFDSRNSLCALTASFYDQSIHLWSCNSDDK